MIDLFAASYVLLWVLVIVLAVAVFVLYHIEGKRYIMSREGRAEMGPALGQPLIVADCKRLNGGIATLPRPRLANAILFATSNCQLCKVLKPAIVALARSNPDIAVTVVCQGNIGAVDESFGDIRSEVDIMVDPAASLAGRLGIGLTPFLVVTDRRGVVVHRSLAGDAAALVHATSEVTSSRAPDDRLARIGGRND